MHANRFAVVVAAVLAACTTALGGDVLQKKDGTFQPAIKGDQPDSADFEASNMQVLDANINEVKLSLSVGDKQVVQNQKAADVTEIYMETKDHPGNWKPAIEAMNGGSYDAAAATFRAIGAEPRVHPVVRQKALLNAGRCMALAGNTKGAEAAYDALLKAFPQSFYTAKAYKEQSQMWMDAGDGAKARNFAELLLKLPGVAESDAIEAKFLQNTVNLREAVANKDNAGIQKALDVYKGIAQETSGRKDFAGVNQLARIGMANAMFELGNSTEAKGIFSEISEKASAGEPAVCAAAFNGLGDCFFKEGNFVDARRCFLRTATIYAEGSPGDQVAKALYHAGQAFARAQDVEDWNTCARRELSECVRRFPKSSWADLAKRALGSLPK